MAENKNNRFDLAPILESITDQILEIREISQTDPFYQQFRDDSRMAAIILIQKSGLQDLFREYEKDLGRLLQMYHLVKPQETKPISVSHWGIHTATVNSLCGGE